MINFITNTKKYLTGRETMFHGSSEQNIESIRQQGLRQSFSGSPGGIVDIAETKVVYNNLMAARTYDRDIGPEWITGSSNFNKLTFDEWSTYVKQNPKSFAKGVGLAGIGVAGVTGVAGLVGTYFGAFQEGGEAEKSRKKHSDFGSPWRGLIKGISRTISKGLSVFRRSPSLSNMPRNTAVSNKVRTALSGAGVRVEQAREFGAFNYWSRQGGEVKLGGVLGVSDDYIQQNIGKWGSGVSAEAYKEAAFLHEASEAAHLRERFTSYAQKQGMNLSSMSSEELTTASIGAMKHGGTYGSHAAKSVIQDELELAAAAGGEVFQAMKNIRMSELKQYSVFSSYRRQVKKMYKTFEKNRFSGKDDAYNIIEGLAHGGLSQAMRRLLTEFGSGWNPIKELLGSAFEEVVSSSAFQKSLKAGKEIKALGKGAFGEAHLMETTFQHGGKSHKLQYVRKRSIGNNPSDFAHEAAGMKKVSHLNAPDVYGNYNDELFMEHFEGRDISKVYREEGLSEESLTGLRKHFEESHKLGVAHGDIGHDIGLSTGSYTPQGTIDYAGEVIPRNMIVDPKGNVGVIDYGLWHEAEATSLSKISQLEGADTTAGFWQYRNLGQGGPASTAADFDLTVLESLERNKGRISEANKAKYLNKKVDALADTAPPEVNPLSHTIDANIKSNSINTANALSPKIRKHQMSIAQKQTSITMSKTAVTGGRKSKSTFSASSYK